MKSTDQLHEEVNAAVSILKKGGLILYPTDTIWGLGCDATNEAAVNRLLELKGRSAEKGLILLLDHTGRLASYVREVPSLAYDLMDYAEKPLTLVLDGAHHVAPNVVASDGSAAFRITHDLFCQKVVERLRKPLVSTSANLSGKAFPLSFNDIEDTLLSGVDYIVNLRRHEKSNASPSKVMRLRTNGQIELLRG
jgi:L-threonylcarbamoyladenylate synthase